MNRGAIILGTSVMLCGWQGLSCGTGILHSMNARDGSCGATESEAGGGLSPASFYSSASSWPERREFVGNRRLGRTGLLATGTVQSTGRDGIVGFTTRTVDLTYVWSGRTLHAKVHLGDDSPNYHPGQTVDVIVDPKDPGHIALPGTSNQSPLTVWPMIFALVGGVIVDGHRRVVGRPSEASTKVPCLEFVDYRELPVRPSRPGPIRARPVAPWRRWKLRRSGHSDDDVAVAADPLGRQRRSAPRPCR